MLIQLLNYCKSSVNPSSLGCSRRLKLRILKHLKHPKHVEFCVAFCVAFCVTTARLFLCHCSDDRSLLPQDMHPHGSTWIQLYNAQLWNPHISYKYSEYIHNIFIIYIYIHKCLKWLCPKDIIGYPPKKLSWGTHHLRITKMMFQSVGLGELGLHYLQKSNCQ